MDEAKCLACLEAPVRPSKVLCFPCFSEHNATLQSVRATPIAADALRKKLWGQRFAKNRTVANRVRIAFAALVLAEQGDDELLHATRRQIVANAGNGSKTAAEQVEPTEVEEEARRISSLEEKLDEDRNGQDHGPGRFRTMDGHFVRSKSEREIANFLFANRVAYQYERPTRIGTVMLRPDFFLPDEGPNGVFVEHFGLMQNPMYAEIARRKALLYERSGRVWVATDETDSHDMDAALRAKLGRLIPRLLD